MLLWILTASPKFRGGKAAVAEAMRGTPSSLSAKKGQLMTLRGGGPQACEHALKLAESVAKTMSPRRVHGALLRQPQCQAKMQPLAVPNPILQGLEGYRVDAPRTP